MINKNIKINIIIFLISFFLHYLYGANCSHYFFPFFFILNLKLKRVTHFSGSAMKEPFSEVAFQTIESLKRPYFPLPRSILAGTNLIMLLLLLLFLQPRLIPKRIHPPFDIRENSSSFNFRENPCKTPKENKKKLLFFLPPCVFWNCSRGFFLLLCHWI